MPGCGETLRRRVKRVPYYLSHPMRVVNWMIGLPASKARGLVANNGERLVIRNRRIAELGGDLTTLAHLQRYYWVASFVSGQRCLDDGCGSGYGSFYLAKCAGAQRVVGIDLSAQAVDFARRHYRHPHLEFQEMNSLQLSFPDETFDVVLSFDVIEHVPEEQQDTFVAETRRVLKKEGALILGCPNRAWMTDISPFHFKELLASEFSELLHRHYADIRLSGQDIVKDGKRVCGDWKSVDNKVRLADLIITQDRPESCFGLLAVCRG